MTIIEFAVPRQTLVSVKVYNIRGQEIATLKDETMRPGYHRIAFDGLELASGIYLIRMKADDFASVRKMLLLK